MKQDAAYPRAMPHYFFNLLEPDLSIIDDEGRELPNVETAIAAAIREARFAVACAIQDGVLDLRGAVHITAPDGSSVVSLPYAHAFDVIRS